MENLEFFYINEILKHANGGSFTFRKMSEPALVKNAKYKKDMRKKLFPGTSSYTNTKVYNKVNNNFINLHKYYSGGTFFPDLKWAEAKKIIGTGGMSNINWFDSLVFNVDLFISDPLGLNNFKSLDEIMSEFNIEAPTLNSSLEILKTSKKAKMFNYSPIKGTTLAVINLNADKAENYIRNGGTFYSPSKGNVTWGKNDYKHVCSTGSYNVLWLLGLPKTENSDLSVDLDGSRLRKMGMSYLTTVDPKNPTAKGYTPLNGDTAVWPKFTRGAGKNKGKVTLHQATYLNGKWYSDTEQLQMSAYSNDPNEPHVKIYRINS